MVMILTKTVTYRGKEIEVSKLKPSSRIQVLIECPTCHKQRHAAYGRIKNNQRCHLCALHSLRKHLEVGSKYSRYEVVGPGTKLGYSLCKCECGTLKEVGNYALTRLLTKSCGCYQKEIVSEVCRGLATRQGGANHPNWKGGISGERELHDAQKETKDWKKRIYERDLYTCQCCGQVGYKLNVHHIQSYSENPALRLVDSNGIALCLKCHTSFHKQAGRKHINQESLNLFLNNPLRATI